MESNIESGYGRFDIAFFPLKDNWPGVVLELKAVKEEADRRGMSCDQVMVLKSTFKTDGEDHKSSLEPNSTYEDYSWILTRTFHEDQWTVEDHGY